MANKSKIRFIINSKISEGDKIKVSLNKENTELMIKISKQKKQTKALSKDKNKES